MTWHADPVLLEWYAMGTTDEARASSVEAHLMACATCRATVAGWVNPERLDRMWGGVAESVDAPRPTPVEWALRRLGTPDHLARLLGATPSLTLSWFLAVAVALSFAVVAAYAGDAGFLVFLVLAPLVPLAGVAAAYGPGIDPTYEVGLAAPMRSFRLLLIRSVAVLATSALMAIVASLFLPRFGWPTAAWLLPALGLSVVSLALSTAWVPAWAFGGVAFAWIASVGGAELASPGTFAAFGLIGQLISIALVVVGASVLIRRQASFDMRRTP